MKRLPVESSQIKAVGYDPLSKCMRVEFQGGSVYGYVGVPAEVFLDVYLADSVGKAFNQKIKAGGYAYAKLAGQSLDAEPEVEAKAS